MTVEDPARVVGLCREAIGEPAPDVAVAILDTATGNLTSATCGVAVAAPLGEEYQNDSAGGMRYDRLTPGALVYLAAGTSRLPVPPPVARDPQSLIHAARATIGDATIAIVSYKLPTRRSRHETLSLSNDLTDIPRVIVAFEEFCARQAIAETAIHGVNVALDEVLTNVISYAFDDGGAHEIYIELQANDQRLVVEIKDNGRPFNPLQTAAPELSGSIEDRAVGGLGIHFVRSILDDVGYRRVDGWNVMTLEKATASVSKA
jgi:anti-sigma regulatory factor (Ser/Thr protein kinase)